MFTESLGPTCNLCFQKYALGKLCNLLVSCMYSALAERQIGSKRELLPVLTTGMSELLSTDWISVTRNALTSVLYHQYYPSALKVKEVHLVNCIQVYNWSFCVMASSTARKGMIYSLCQKNIVIWEKINNHNFRLNSIYNSELSALMQIFHLKCCALSWLVKIILPCLGGLVN